ncbi:MAG: 4-alpha-glucanotransferase [Provencibacterium sp.]|jgi:4-alpha-glucanotransferase|nr:4-alpha-glucanotransferase [Provencibacterium sp.]
MTRASGILLPVFSLPSPYGIGTFGREAYRFVNFLAAAGQQYWQILPVGPTSYGDSPYQSFSTFAGNPYFIDLELLQRRGLLTGEELEAAELGEDPQAVDYALLFQNRYPLLRAAYERAKGQDGAALARFRQKHARWLEDYALFMALKGVFANQAWKNWPEDIRLRRPEALRRWQKELAEECGYWAWLQMVFFRQWGALKRYANKKGIAVIGDLPIYVAEDSADAWANPDIFWFDEDLNPVKVAGVPPDGFSATGQLWGNPLYRWDVLRERGYDWWVDRVRMSLSVYDRVRIDHFRGFDTYYAVPYGDTTAERGEWMEGPGIELFERLNEELGEAYGGKLPIIAEDLGYLTESVRELLKGSGFPGMKVLEFAFDSREQSDYLPHNYGHNCVVYTGTHDNDTVCGWFKTAPAPDVRFCRDYLRLTRWEGWNWGFIRGAWGSTADLAIAQMQDFLALGSEARINTPSTLGGNWCWRLRQGMLTASLAKKIRRITQLYGRQATE